MRLLALSFLTLALATLNSCNKVGSNATAPTATPITYSIAGHVETPLGPVRDAGVKLYSYTDEACIQLGKKPDQSAEEKKQFAECKKLVIEVKTNEKGEYGFPNLQAGWYALYFHWRVALKSNLESGADLTGDYQIFYGHPEPDKFGFAAVGYPFKLGAGEKVTKDLFYGKGPYSNEKK